MSDSRPDPDALLQAIRRTDEVRGHRGKLKVFLGASAGVGKTYAMLSEAHAMRDRGVDVVIGVVETHGRAETEALVAGLPQIPQREAEKRGAILREFDLDATLERRPGLVVVDELAHTNAPGSRHAKRYQDVLELLDAGIDVYTAVNIQHLESLNDVVAQVTGVIVRETVPDAMLDDADRVELIDIPPEELQLRLREGKVYVPERVETALQGFFKMGNLLALRELALRRTADRVDADMTSYRIQEGVQGLWATRGRIIACIAPSPLAERVIRSAARMASTSHAEIMAVYVESDRQVNRSANEKVHAQHAIELATQMGIETVILNGHDIVAEILNFAQKRNGNLIVVGKPVKARWKEVVYGSVVDELVRRSGDIDVYVITEQDKNPKSPMRRPKPAKPSGRGLIESVVVTAIATAICFACYPRLDLSNLVMIYLLGVTYVASRNGVVEAALTAVLSVLAFDFGFVPPRFALAVSDSQYLVTFAVMLVVALLIASLTQRLKQQAAESAARERRTASMYVLSKQLAQTRSKRELCEIAAKEIRSVFGVDVAVYLVAPNGIVVNARSHSGFDRAPGENAVADWVAAHGQRAGKGTDTLPGARGFYVPLIASTGVIGVVAIENQEDDASAAQSQLLETFINALGAALERTILARESNAAKIRAETERMRSTLLSSISHDLRTPLTAITGAASSLVLGKGETKELASMIVDESSRLNHQIQNLLDLTSLQSGSLAPKMEWQSVRDMVGSAMAHVKAALGPRPITIDVPDELPLLKVDGALVEKAIANLLENAATHTRATDSLNIDAKVQNRNVVISIRDTGPGLPDVDPKTLFAFGFRKNSGGFGLGLAVCRAIMDLHQGSIDAENQPTGGAAFHLTFPAPDHQPETPRG